MDKSHVYYAKWKKPDPKSYLFLLLSYDALENREI